MEGAQQLGPYMFDPRDRLLLAPESLEVQLAYTAGAIARRLLHFDALILHRFDDETKKEMQEREDNTVGAALRRFLRSVRVKAKQHRSLASDEFRVRIISSRTRADITLRIVTSQSRENGSVPGSPRVLHEELLDSFTLSFANHARIETVKRRFWQEVLSALNAAAPFASAAGAPPDSRNLARWWALTVFEHKAPWLIAEEEARGDEHTEYFVMTNIERRLNEVGVRPARE